MKRERPIVISVICIYFFFMNLFPTAPLMTKAFELGREFSNGGFERFYSAYKASVTPMMVENFILVSVVYIAIVGMWCMKRWSVFMLAGAMAWGLYQLFLAGIFTIFSFFLPAIATLTAFYFFFKKPTVRVHQPKVHYYSGTPNAKDDEDDDAEPKGEKSALEELIY